MPRCVAAILLIAQLGLFAFCAASKAGEPTSQPTPRVLALVKELSDDAFATRESAQAGLVAMGTDIEPQLRQVLQGNLPPEALMRVKAVLDNMAILPSVITLQFTNAPLMDVLEEFARQAKADMGIHGQLIMDYARDRRLTIHVDHVSFWEALGTIEAASDLRPDSWETGSGTSRMILQIDKPNSHYPLLGPNILGGHAKVVGPFLVAPISAARTQMFDNLDNQASPASMGISLMLLAEPKIALLSPLNQDWLIDAVDENGNSLAEPSHFVQQGLDWCQPLSVGLKMPANLGKTVARLRGKLHFVVETKSEVVDIADLAKFDSINRTFLGEAITLEKQEKAKNDWAIVFKSGAIRVRPPTNWMDPPWNKDDLLMARLRASLQLYDASANLMYEQEGGTETDGEMSVFFRSADGRSLAPEPKSLRWNIPAATVDLTLPLELDDLKLPVQP